MGTLDIGDVVQRSGLAASTLRYYEQRGLIASVRRHGLRRQFDSDVVDRLALISLGREAGFSLDEISQMVTPDGQPKIDRSQLLDKADEIDDTITRLSALRDNLRHTAHCRASSHLECPSFQRLLKAAGRRRPLTQRPSKRPG